MEEPQIQILKRGGKRTVGEFAHAMSKLLDLRIDYDERDGTLYLSKPGGRIFRFTYHVGAVERLTDEQWVAVFREVVSRGEQLDGQAQSAV